MDTSILKFTPATADPFVESLMFHRLCNMKLELIPNFLTTYCRFICTCPLLSYGCLTEGKQLDLFFSTQIFGIFLFDGIICDSDEELHVQTANTLYHEMIHIMLMVVGYPEHNEEKISECSQHLAYRQPEILQIVEDLYPGFKTPFRKHGCFWHKDITPQFVPNAPYKNLNLSFS